MFPSSFPDFPSFLSDSKHHLKPTNPHSSPLSHGFFLQMCVTFYHFSFHPNLLRQLLLFCDTSLLLRLPATGLLTLSTVLMCYVILPEYCFLTLHLPHKSSRVPLKGPTQAQLRLPDKSLLTVPQCGPRNSQLSEPLLYILFWHQPPLSPLLIPSPFFTVQSLCQKTSSNHSNPQ